MTTTKSRNAVAAMILCCMMCLCISCGPAPAASMAAPRQPVEPSLYERSASLYLLPTTSQKLLIEVDVVEGCEPRQIMLDNLEEFLRRYTSKEIQWRRKPPIPRADAAGVPPTALAVRHMQGLDEGADADERYLYILFCEEGNTGYAAWVHNFYPCAIFVNMTKPWWQLEDARDHLLKHEAGHVLGLCLNIESSGREVSHCRNKCLMQPGFSGSILRYVKGMPTTELCDDCRQKIAALKAQEISPKMEFKGPFLVRYEEQYRVATLPCFYGINLCDDNGSYHYADGFLPECLQIAREDTAPFTRPWQFGFAIATKSNADIDRLLPRARSIQNDPDSRVRSLAETLEHDLMKDSNKNTEDEETADVAPDGESQPQPNQE